MSALREDAVRVHDPALLDLAVQAEAQARGIDAGLGGEEALGELLACHLQREDGDLGVLADGGVAREVQHQRRLADTGTGGDDDRSDGLRPPRSWSRSLRPVRTWPP